MSIETHSHKRILRTRIPPEIVVQMVSSEEKQRRLKAEKDSLRIEQRNELLMGAFCAAAFIVIYSQFFSRVISSDTK